MVIVVVLASSTLAAQTVYSWKDSSGVTHYSENAPRSGKAKSLHLGQTDPVLDAAPAPAVSATPVQPAGDPLESAKRDYPKLACANARTNQKILHGHGLILAPGDPENPADATSARKLSPQEISAASAEAQKQIDQFCDRGQNS
jgi:hypothetical protein